MPIMRFNSHKSLYRYFMNEQASPSAYLDWYKKFYITRGIEPPLQDQEVIMLFWESGGEPETEKSLLLQNNHFTWYVKLAATSGTGKVRELGVFLKT